MTTLHEKLKEILVPIIEDADLAGYAGGPTSTRKQLEKEALKFGEQIEQAFIDDGWLKPGNNDSYHDAMIAAYKKAHDDRGLPEPPYEEFFKAASVLKNAKVPTRDRYYMDVDGVHGPVALVDPADVHVHVCSNCPQKGTTAFMTGQEWYDKYEKELQGHAFITDNEQSFVIQAVDECKSAARRAAGLKEESND